jgi:hypothetical protein
MGPKGWRAERPAFASAGKGPIDRRSAESAGVPWLAPSWASSVGFVAVRTSFEDGSMIWPLSAANPRSINLSQKEVHVLNVEDVEAVARRETTAEAMGRFQVVLC